jgi:hypothetical protein
MQNIMVFKLLKIFIFTIIALSSQSVFGEKRIGSKGHLDCGQFLSSCDNDLLDIDCQTQTFFVEGYLSGVSWEKDIPIREYNQDSIKYALIKFCRANPLKLTHDGAISILQELK